LKVGGSTDSGRTLYPNDLICDGGVLECVRFDPGRSAKSGDTGDGFRPGAFFPADP
jgi:hypothetical protein